MGRHAGLIWVVAVGLALAGCSSETAKKADSGASSGSPARGAGQMGKSPVSRQGSSGSSLDAHKEGKSPESGPLKEIYFDFDRYDLSSAARSNSNRLAASRISVSSLAIISAIFSGSSVTTASCSGSGTVT